MKRHMKYVHEREELRSVTFVKIVLFYNTEHENQSPKCNICEDSFVL